MTDATSVRIHDGLLDLNVSGPDNTSTWEIAGAQAGIQRAGEPLMLSSTWQVVDAHDIHGEDRCGQYTGVQTTFSTGEHLLVVWRTVVYARQSTAAFEMSVTNRGQQDTRIVRLSPLMCDPSLGARLDVRLQPARSFILNNGMWMDTPHERWRVPVPDSEPFEGYWSVGLGEPGVGALVAGIGEAANACAGISLERCGDALGLILNGWTWADTRRQPLRLPPGGSFQLQRMLLCRAEDLHTGLVAYAEFVRRYLNLQLHFPPYAGIFSAYGGDPAGEHPERHPLNEERVALLCGVVDDYLQPYGLDTFKTQFAGLSSGPPGMVGRRSTWTDKDIAPARDDLVERIYRSAFTPDVYDSRIDFPHGIEAHVRDLKRRGYRPALVCRPFLNVRSDGPEYDELAADVFEMAVRRWGYEYLMFDFNSEDYETADDTHTVEQGIRSRFQAVRNRVGPDVFIEACMVMPGPVLGIADGFRHANDWRGGTEEQLARQACTRYYYHGRWFQLDHEFFDPQLRSFTWVEQGVQGMLASLDRVRLWTSFGGLTGFSWLTGGAIENVSAERWGIFAHALPVYGPCARPVDLLLNDPPHIWVLDARVAGQPYQVAGVFNWHEQPLSLTLDAQQLGVAGGVPYLFYDFWDQRVTGPADGVNLNLPPCSCKVLFIHRMQDEPVWLGTDRHVTGAIGMRSLKINSDELAGECTGPAGTQQRHYFYLPENVIPTAAEQATYEVSQYRVLRVTIDVGTSGVASWRVHLRRGSRIL
jgi:hypothetical protein